MGCSTGLAATVMHASFHFRSISQHCVAHGQSARVRAAALRIDLSFERGDNRSIPRVPSLLNNMGCQERGQVRVIVMVKFFVCLSSIEAARQENGE